MTAGRFARGRGRAATRDLDRNAQLDAQDGEDPGGPLQRHPVVFAPEPVGLLLESPTLLRDLFDRSTESQPNAAEPQPNPKFKIQNPKSETNPKSKCSKPP